MIARQGFEILGSDQAVIYSNVDNQLRIETQHPQSSEKVEADGSDAAWCVRYLKPKVSVKGSLESPTEHHSLCVPLVATQNRVLAVLEFRNDRPQLSFSETDVRVATCLARVATIALDRARLFFRIEEWKQSIETLLSFNATVNQQLAPEEMVRELVANVTGFLNADGGAAGIAIRGETGMMVQSNGFYFANLWYSYDRTWKPGEGIPGVVLETEFPYLSEDYNADTHADPVLTKKFDLGPCISVPIKNAHEGVLGFFQLHRRPGQAAFTWQDAAFLESLGNTAAVAIENARLVKSLELKNVQIKNLSQDHVRRLEEERRHIARELHDETGQVLIGLKLRLQILSGLLTDDQEDAKSELDQLRQQVNCATVQLKELAKKLRPPTLDELGFEAALRQLVADFRHQVDFSIQIEVQAKPKLSGLAETALYRITQECLTNVVKHAKASQVEIRFKKNGERQVLRIADNGVGFDVASSTDGLGHIGIHERVRMLDGEVTVKSKQGKGTTIEVLLAEMDDC